MNNQNLIKLIDSINQISLNHDDLLKTVMDFSEVYIKNNPDDQTTLGYLFENMYFIDQSITAARESVVLAMNAITLTSSVPFEELIKGCVNISSQRENESLVCEDEKTKELMQNFLRELRKEIFSQMFSRNKNFNKVANLPKDVLSSRYNFFMKENF